ncbi:hypothetical protein TRIUR3_28024 [Triticum urartu]|uniref:Uncharacterized protein n=1 Tax=Triticum urartu TaxID=4572 RepID=M7ZNT8_TRIUA|nr:hypothetical protein TRIUR3_28024 [Triticum urartu]
MGEDGGHVERGATKGSGRISFPTMGGRLIPSVPPLRTGTDDSHGIRRVMGLDVG